MQEESEDQTTDTRQSHTHSPDLANAPDPIEDQTMIEDTVDQLQDLYVQRATLESYHGLVKAAGPDGLDHVASQIMMVNLNQLKLRRNSVGMESFDMGVDRVTIEDFSEWLSDVGEKIKALIERLVQMAKDLAARVMSGVEGVKKQSEELIDRIRNRGRKPANELHDENREITISDPGILWANGKFCVEDCKSEQEVIKFFVNIWPKYAKDQISRAKKMMAEYDVANGNLEDFDSNLAFVGNHKSLVANITRQVLPGNVRVGFKYGALGPELVEAEDATPAPASHSFEVRPVALINNTLKANVATMNALASMFRSEADVLHDMSTMSEALMKLEDRRGEALWKSARADLDEISKKIMDLIGRLKPNYDPIARHLAKVGTARNMVCRKELDALGQ